MSVSPLLLPLYLLPPTQLNTFVRVQLKRDGTRWRTVGEVKGKLANGVGSQYPSQYLGTWCIQHYYRWCAHLGCQYSTELTPPADLNWLVGYAERRNLVSARVPSHHGSNARYTMFRVSVMGTGYLLHSPFAPSLPLPCVTVCHHVSARLYLILPSDPTRDPRRSTVSAMSDWRSDAEEISCFRYPTRPLPHLENATFGCRTVKPAHCLSLVHIPLLNDRI